MQTGAGDLEGMRGKLQCHLTCALALMAAQTVHLSIGYDGGIARKNAVYELLLYESICYHYRLKKFFLIRLRNIISRTEKPAVSPKRMRNCCHIVNGLSDGTDTGYGRYSVRMLS